MLVDRFGNKMPESIDEPPDSSVYAGQRSGETMQQYLERRRREGLIEGVVIVLIIAGFLALFFWTALHGKV